MGRKTFNIWRVLELDYAVRRESLPTTSRKDGGKLTCNRGKQQTKSEQKTLRLNAKAYYKHKTPRALIKSLQKQTPYTQILKASVIESQR